MAVEVLLPKIGLTMQEGTIDEWLVPTGAAVAEGDALLRLATDKVDVDVEAEAAGLFHPLVPAGATVPAGALIGWLLAEGEQPPTPAGSGIGADTAAAPALDGDGAAAPPTVNGSGDRLLSSPNARRVAAAADVDLTAVRGTGPGGRIVSEDVEEYLASRPGGLLTPLPPGGTPSSPLVRKLAKERGIDLSEVSGSGPGGRIRRADLEEVAPAAGPTHVRTSDVIPLTGMRGTIARRMHASLQEMAQLTHGYEVRMDAVVSLRDRLKEECADSDLPVPSLNDFLLKASALALRRHPLLNATVRQDGVHLLDGIHLGFAVAVPGGLMVPVIEDAVALPLTEIARRSRALAQAAREGRISPAQLEGATFTVTSLGGYGVDFFTPVINPGNVAILGVGRLRDGVEWAEDRPLRTRVLTLSLTFDHRAVDGAPAADYLRTVGELLSKPLRLLL
ncbi:2-oxo acid dehydrogenase subunit E2 [Streptomyces sp. NBC_00582]|uniref:2-oxo acid dehydrogenase subunit E2 n=1 Tax=Streptomyces sp. NBC_00582 TaxID=2975783 RepID=UPI002E81F26E|nr:2-oxo acid dehydrogenase subunit E2 [Streptomyces sp. NBC_00582]WUB67229.1 2-oxo acid dehydrogenase subunit E2 [Streptomyces sp. NBC_00582]